MKYNVTYSCGHNGEVELYGPGAQRERRIWSIENRELCPDCEEKERARRAEEARKVAAEKGLPTLVGTGKQVNWAEQLRNERFARINELIASHNEELARGTGIQVRIRRKIENIQRLKAYISTVDSASWWIKWREESIDFLYRMHLEQIETTDKRLAEEADPMMREVAEEATIRPENVTKGVANVKILGNEITAFYERDDDFRTIVKALRFKWSPEGIVWKRTITERCGNTEDRAAELVNALLAKGFAVTCLDDVVREKAVKADYAPECDRWIDGKNDMELLAYFSRDEKLKSIVMKIGGVWNGYYCAYVVGVSRYKDLEELARLYGFCFTRGARKTIKNHVAKLESATVTEVATKPAPDQRDPFAEILQSSCDVLPDLKDDDA